MVVLVGNLPKLAAEKELCRKLHIPSDTRVRILKTTDGAGSLRRFALVPVTGDHRRRKLIRRAQGINWLGQELNAHVYEHRTGANERRRVDWRKQPWSGKERRLNERRGRSAQGHSVLA